MGFDFDINMDIRQLLQLKDCEKKRSANQSLKTFVQVNQYF